jgi:hypothetical protein
LAWCGASIYGSSVAAQAHVQAPEAVAAAMEGRIEIDGRLTDSAWTLAVPITAFTQTDPRDGAPASLATEVRVVLGTDALYVGARMFDDQPEQIRASLSRRDAVVESDFFEVGLDSQHGHRTARIFRVTVAGSILDATLAQDAEPDYAWDAVWEAATRRDSTGWSAELKLPLSQLDYAANAVGMWGIQLTRFVSRKQETHVFSWSSKEERGGVSRYGHLTGLRRIVPSRRIELLPYAVTRSENLSPPGAGPQGEAQHDVSGSAGLDLRYRLNSSFTTSLSVNPDFGQVEVDPAVVNLTTFETFFPERRPFFVEGSDIFGFGELGVYNQWDFPTMLHTRRVGRAPQGAVTEVGASGIHTPTETSIPIAAKLRGRTDNGWSIGVLDAVTAEETAQFTDSAGVRATSPVEPTTNYFAGRVRREFRGGGTAVGALVTAVDRRMHNSELAAALRSSAYTAGLDLTHAWADRTWQIDASISASRIAGSAEAVAATQLSSVHNFQRPDSRQLLFEPASTSLGGHGLQLALSKKAGRHWIGSFAYQEVSPGFESNDLGFTARADQRAVSTYLEYKEEKPGRLARRFSVAASTYQVFNFDSDVYYAVVSLAPSLKLKNYWDVGVELKWYPEYVDDRKSEGGPLILTPAGPGLHVTFQSDPRRLWSLAGGIQLATFPGGYADRRFSLSLGWQPSAALKVGMEGEMRLNRFTNQFVAAIPDSTAKETFGSRYVFGELGQTQVSFTANVDWVITPKLSIQVFAQPLLSAGRYERFKELLRPRSFDFNVYGDDVSAIPPDPVTGARVEDPTFDIGAWRFNAVLRWEHRPGSTIFLVWQQSRDSFEQVGRLRLGHDLSELFAAPAQNVILLKVTYWIGG